MVADLAWRIATRRLTAFPGIFSTRTGRPLCDVSFFSPAAITPRVQALDTERFEVSNVAGHDSLVGGLGDGRD